MIKWYNNNLFRVRHQAPGNLRDYKTELTELNLKSTVEIKAFICCVVHCNV